MATNPKDKALHIIDLLRVRVSGKEEVTGSIRDFLLTQLESAIRNIDNEPELISLANPTRKPKLDLVLEHLAATELDRVCDAIREHFGNEIAEEVDVRLSVEDSVDDAIRTLSWVLKNYPKPKLNRKEADEINQEDLEAAADMYDRLYDRWFQVQCPSCGDTVTNGNSSRILFEGRLLHCKNCEMGITLIFDKHPKP